MLKDQVRVTFDIIDKDKNGKVSPAELKKFLFEPMSENDLSIYVQNLNNAKVGCCENGIPLVSIASFLSYCLAGVLHGHTAGCCCLLGTGLAAYRINQCPAMQDNKDSAAPSVSGEGSA